MTGEPADTTTGRPRRRAFPAANRLVSLPVLVAALVAALLLTATSTSGPLAPGEVVVLDTPNPNLEVPVGATITARDGKNPLVLERERTGDREILRLEDLEPGTYHVTWPGRGYGGAHTPERATYVMVDAIDDTIDDTGTGGRDTPLPGPVTATATVALLLTALAAVRAGRGTGRRTAFSTGTLVGLALWGGSGWSSPAPATVAAWGLAAGVIACTLLTGRRNGDELLVTAALTVLLWPGALAASIAVAVAAASLPVAARATSARLIPGMLLTQILVAVIGVVGTAGRPDVPYAGLDFAECARRESVDPAVGRECFRALGARLGATLPAGEASRALLEGLDSAGVRRDSQCRTAGVALSHAAARWGADRDDPRALFVDILPICDYSSMHGIVAGAYAHTDPATFSASVLALCVPQSPDETRLNSPEYSRQCWQAAGIALGRRTRYEDGGVLDICLQAEPYGTNNCTDGYFQELVDQEARAASRPQTRLPPEETSILSLCSGLPGSLSGGCYRYVGEEVFYEGGTRAQGLSELEDVCTNRIPDDHMTSCWYALGMVSVRTLLHGTFDQLEQPPLAICPNAPTARARLQCLHGGGNAIVGLLGRETDVERICSWFPEERRKEYCDYTRRYVDHLKEGDPTS